MTSTPNLYPVRLTAEDRERLQQITRYGQAPVRKVRNAQVLLLSDRNRPEGPLTRDQIAETLGMHVNTVDRIRKRFVLEGEKPVLNRKPRITPPVPPKIDGRAEAHLVAICCSQAPTGRTRWTLKLLAKELVDRRVVTSVCAETVRRVLKKMNCSLGASSVGAFQKETGRGSLPKWRTSLTSTPRSTRRKSR
jgi:transposase